MNEHLPALRPEKAGEIMEAVIARGDLARLDPGERAKYYTRVCESMGLNPLTKPFDYITLNGKLTLYALKTATDQLRKIYGVSVVDMTEKREGDLIVVTVKVQDATGRTDMSKGALSLGSLKGEALANAIMKCETKAKRRATLSICGLGFLDETEVETIPGAKPAPRVLKKDHRADYHAMQLEMDECATVDDLWKWRADNGARINALPQDWQGQVANILAAKADDMALGEPVRNCGEILSDPGPAPRHDEPPPEVLWADPQDTPPEWSEKWEALGPVTQAGTLCKESAFKKFVTEHAISWVEKWEGVEDFVRQFCGVASRKELATNEGAAKRWRALVAEYRAWQRTPEIDPVTPHRHGAHPDAAATDGAPADDAGRGDAAGASEVPTAAAYTAQWNTILDGAVPSKRAQIGKAWNEQNALRDQIAWTEAHPFKALKKRVVAVLEQLQEGA